MKIWTVFISSFWALKKHNTKFNPTIAVNYSSPGNIELNTPMVLGKEVLWSKKESNFTYYHLIESDSKFFSKAHLSCGGYKEHIRVCTSHSRVSYRFSKPSIISFPKYCVNNTECSIKATKPVYKPWELVSSTEISITEEYAIHQAALRSTVKGNLVWSDSDLNITFNKSRKHCIWFRAILSRVEGDFQLFLRGKKEESSQIKTGSYTLNAPSRLKNGKLNGIYGLVPC